MFPKITIITPTLNHGEFIEETILSVIKQNYPNLEYIIIDGGSKDNTINIIKKYEKHINCWISEPDKGQSDAINKGLKIATGEIINWLNSDDTLTDNALVEIAKNYTENVLLICGKTKIFEDSNGYTEIIQTNIYSDNITKTIGYETIIQPSTFFSRKALSKIGSNVNESLHYCMDYELWLRFLFFCGLLEIKYVDSILANFRLHNDSKSVKAKKLFKTETISIYYSLSKIYNLAHEEKIIKTNFQNTKTINLQWKHCLDKNTLKSSIHYHLLFQAHNYYIEGKYRKSRSILLKINPTLIQAEKRLLKKLLFRSNPFISPLIRILKYK